MPDKWIIFYQCKVLFSVLWVSVTVNEGRFCQHWFDLIRLVEFMSIACGVGGNISLRWLIVLDSLSFPFAQIIFLCNRFACLGLPKTCICILWVLGAYIAHWVTVTWVMRTDSFVDTRTLFFLFSASCQLRKISFVVFAWLVIGIAFFIRPETMTELRDAPGEWRKETLESGFQME